MFLPHPHRLSKPLLVFMALFAIPIGGIELVKWIKVCWSHQSPIVQGTIAKRKKVSPWGIPRARLTIDLVNQPATVQTVVANGIANKLPTQVNFHYSG